MHLYFQFGFFCLLSSSYTHRIGFSGLIFSSAPTLRHISPPLASNLGFSAYFLPPTPTAWVFPVLYSLPRPLLATFLHLALPIWVFLLTFLLLHPPHGFFRSYILFRAHSSPHFSTSRFQFGFFCLLSYSYTHRMVFSGLIFSSAPTPRHISPPRASNLGFSAYFLTPTPTAWFFPVLYSLPRPLLATFLHLSLPIWVFLLTFFLSRPLHGFFRSYILFLTHSSPHFSTSRFQFGFFCLLSYSYAHRVGFSGLIFSSAPTSLCHMIYFRKKSRTFILLSCV